MRTWLFPALRDLYCAFSLSADNAFEYPERFLEISALEKSLKAVLLFNRYADYEQLSVVEARERVTEIARSRAYGHNFRGMLGELAKLPGMDVRGIIGKDYGGYRGDDLVDVVRDGYEEVRYPVAEMVADRFAIGRGWTSDPLRSSALTEFIYALCGMCIRALPDEDIRLVLQRLRVLFHHRSDELRRFERLFVEPYCARKLPPLPEDFAERAG